MQVNPILANGQTCPADPAPSTSLDVNLGAKDLAVLGLTEEDLSEVRQLAAQIDVRSALSISVFGHNVAEHTSQYADELLDLVRNNELDAAGGKLTEVVGVARKLNVKSYSDRRSRMPLVGPLIDRFRLKKGAFMDQFDSTKGQIETLVGEVETTQGGLAKRNDSLETMFNAVKEAYRLLGVHIAAGRIRKNELQAELDAMDLQEASPTQVQEISDLRANLVNLDIRIGNLLSVQQLSLQTLPQIRMVQSSNRTLIEKFYTIKQVTIPAWKDQFLLAMALNEQRNAKDLADAIDETSQSLLTGNAALLHQNAVETAKANQRLVISTATLQQVQSTLIKTVEDVLDVQRAGAQTRAQAVLQIEGMRTQLKAQLGQHIKVLA